MQNKIVFFFFGAVAGFIITALISHFRGDSTQDALHRDRSAMIEATIDAIEALQDGENEAAQLMLVSAVNAQAQMILREPNVSDEDLKSARDWQLRLRDHSERLGLEAGQPHPEQ